MTRVNWKQKGDEVDEGKRSKSWKLACAGKMDESGIV